MIESFTIGGVEWKVKVDNNRLEDLGVLGLCEYYPATISLLKKENMSKDIVEQTLYHEVCHAILDTMGEKELSNNEKFVETFSTLLHQFEKSKVDTESVITKYLEEEATKDYIKTHPIEANQISVSYKK